VRYQLLAACLTGVVFGVPSLSHAAPTYQVLHAFNSEAAGSNPFGGVLPGSGGKLYGVMDEGGSMGDGLDYVLVPPKGTGKSREIVLHNFTGGADGAFPFSGFGMNAAGVLFGAVGAKDGSQGTLYSLTPLNKSGTAFSLATLFTFSGANGDGPEGAPVVGADGALYGVTLFGGSAGFGAIYKLSPPAKGQTVWTETVLHSFTAGTDGNNPFDAGVALDKSGALFGTTFLGGTFGQGIAFKLTPPAQGGTEWTEAILRSFGNGTDGEGPLSKLVIGEGGTLYGTLSQGGSANLGLVYSLTPAGHGAFTYQTLHAFAGGKDGGNPFGDLSRDASGTIFGTAGASSAHTLGTIFSVIP
jgi:uncharacterized repeat protein (TIGR03803 family)